MLEATPRVLSIQSHVVHGHVGNKCAIFPLQLHGFEVDFINSVQFSNHTAYPHWKGQVLSSEELTELFEGLKLNSLHQNYTHVLTGYIADESFLETLAKELSLIHDANKNVTYLCDPVLGDGGNYYVQKELMPLYKRLLLPLADIITPNQFELSELSGVKVDSEVTCIQAIQSLHQYTKIVVVTSTELSSDPDFMWGYASEKDGNLFRFEVSRFDATFLGTGDLFSTLLLIWYSKSGRSIRTAIQRTLSAMQELLTYTLSQAQFSAKKEGRSKPSPKDLELKLVQCQESLLNPKREIKIQDL